MRNAHETMLIDAIETHSSRGVRSAIEAGLDPNGAIDGRRPIEWMLEMYTRSDRFAECIGVLADAGATFDDALLKHVLLNDAAGVRTTIIDSPAMLSSRYTIGCSFTPLDGATPLHVAAEYGNAEAARALIEAGADVDSPSAADAAGFNGATPIFHTVHSPHNHCEPVLGLLLEAGARCDVQLSGLIWGRGFEWETIVLDVTPISYAMLGLLPQFHRDERAIHANIECMLRASGRHVPGFENVPNQYVSAMRARENK